MEDAETEKQVMLTHDLFWDALAKRDLETRFALCANDITFIGTGLGEYAADKAAYKEINRKGIEQFPDPFKIEFLRKHLSIFNTTAWVESEVTWKQEINKNITTERVRNTTVLKYENNKWWIAHVHGSAPDYRLQGGNYMTNETTIIRNNELERQVHERTDELNKTLKNLKATQAQLIHSEKMASLGELTAGIAHEIQNPLNFVNNFSEVSNELVSEIQEERSKAQVTRDEQMQDEILNDIKQNLEKIHHHGKRADSIVKGMLQHSRKSTGIKEPTDINALCDEYLRLSFHGLRAKDKTFNADFKTDFDESIGKINIVPQDIGRVLLNLFNNAFYATGKKQKDLEGFQNLQGLSNYKPLVSIQTKKLNDKIEIKVSDNGNGIPQNIIDKIFQPFFTTKPTGQGTGLGLSLAYDIITKEHNGIIKAESEVDEGNPDNFGKGEGTIFIIQLPVS